jgi:hypothetical protein
MSVTPSPIGGFAAQFFDNNGQPLSGGKIYTYAAGTTTPQATYTSALGITPHSNPIILDSAGRVPGGEIWLTDGLIYKFKIDTATDVLIGTYDNIIGVNSNFVNYTVQEEVQTATAGQTVFNLATINYTPATNSLSVYIDGVNQYVGDSYLETDSNTVTFTAGLHVGAEIKFTTAVQVTTGTMDAGDVGYTAGYTGADPQTVQTKLDQYIYPEDFGAVGDGVADDTVAVRDAMDAAVANGLPLRLRMGATYLLSTWTVYTPAGRLSLMGETISGATGNTTLRGPASTVVCLSPSTNFEIKNVVFDRWTSAVSRSEVESGSFDYVVVEKCRFTNCTSNVIAIQKAIANYRIIDNEFENSTGTVGSTAYGILIGANTYANQDTWQEGWISRNRFKTMSATGTRSLAAVLAYGRRLTVSDNKIDNLAQSGTGEAWGIYTKSRYSQVYGNFVNNVTAAGSSDNVGINIKGTTRAVTSSPQGFSVAVWGNQVSNVGVVASSGAGIRAQTDDVLVTGNLVENCRTALVSDESAAYRNVRIQSNLVRYASVVAGTVGVLLEGAGTNVVADGNTVMNAATGTILRTGPTTSTMQDGQVINNIYNGCDNGIIFDAFTGCTLDRPVFDNNVVTGGTYGLLFNGSAGTVSNIRVRNNDFARATNPVVGAILTSAASAYGNFGWLSASATWDPPSVANGASTTTTLTVGGAVLGDMVNASFSLSLGGLSLSAQVSAADTVQVRLSNNSGAPVDLASGTIRVQVFKGVF